MKAKKKNPASKVQKTDHFILLDRSGSMSMRWDETLSSLNAYATELQKAKEAGAITLACFDDYQGLQFDVLRNHLPIKDWRKITPDEATPRGSTPLMDAAARLVALAEKNDAKKSVIVVITDGQENASREVTKEHVQKMIKRCKDRGWQVVFLGADFDAFDNASMSGVGKAQTLNMTAGNYATVMRSVALQASGYTTMGAAMSFSDDDRLTAQGKL